MDQTLDHVLAEIADQLAVMNESGGRQKDAGGVFVRQFDGARRGSRFVADGSDRSLVEYVAGGGEIDGTSGVKTLTPSHARRSRDIYPQLKALAAGTGSSGGSLVFPELAPELTPLLRARTCVLALGAPIIPVRIEMDVAGLSTGATANFVQENAAIPTSEETFSFSSILKPKPLAAMVPISNRLLADEVTNPSLEMAVRGDLAAVIGLRLDLAFLRGTGTGGEPLGLRNRSDITLSDLGGATPDYDTFIDVLATQRELNAPMETVGWIFHPRLLRVLQKLKTSTGAYLTDAGLLTFDPQGAGGMLLGYPFRTTTQIPANMGGGNESEVYLGEWGEYWVGQESDMRIEVSTEASYTPDGGETWVSAFQNDQTLLRAIGRWDGAPRRGNLFQVLTGVAVPEPS